MGPLQTHFPLLEKKRKVLDERDPNSAHLGIMTVPYFGKHNYFECSFRIRYVLKGWSLAVFVSHNHGPGMFHCCNFFNHLVNPDGNPDDHGTLLSLVSKLVWLQCNMAIWVA